MIPSSSALDMLAHSRRVRAREEETLTQQLRQQQERRRPSPFDNDPTGLADLRLQIQASKLAFIVSKRSQVLAAAGLTLRREGSTPGAGEGGGGGGGGGEGADGADTAAKPVTSTSTIQEFLDRTWAARHVSRRRFNPFPGLTNNVECPPATGYNREGMDAFTISALRVQYGQSRGDPSGRGGDGDGGGDDLLDFSSRFETWRDMTFVFCEELGWVFLHQVTEGAIEVVQALFSTVHCHEMGVLMADPANKATIEGLASALSTCRDVSVYFDGAIVKIAGTELQVYNLARAIEAVDSSAQRLHSAAHWYFQGPTVQSTVPPPWFPMDAEASRGLEEAFARRGESEGGTYQSGGATYRVNFALMTQINAGTGFVRTVRRVLTDRRPHPLPRCPQKNMPLTGFSFSSTTAASLVEVSEEEERMVTQAVGFTYGGEVAKVQHVWNSFLWEHYAQNAKSIGNECLLFHGARSEALGTIIRTGFEKRLAGSSNGVSYGQGCYFARDACLAAHYMAPPPCGGQMIMAKVLVGHFTKGNRTMMVPPKMPSSERHFDTTSNSDHSPALIVTYKDWQAYPMYLITFAPRTEEAKAT